VILLSRFGRWGAVALGCGALWLGSAAAGRVDAGHVVPLESAEEWRDAAPRYARAPEDVVLLHGLARGTSVMRPLARELAAAGFRVHNLDYPSTRATPESLVEVLHGEIARCCAASGRVHFVTHSLGGVVLRAYLAAYPMPEIGRVVMLAPPNHGSEYVDIAGGWKLFQLLLGPTAAQLGTSPESLPNRLPPPDFEVGVIAGTGSINPLGDALIAGANDGTVSVASTQLAGMRDFIEVNRSHTFILRDPEVAQQAIAFLRVGRFAR
jgi:triacylglycerol lipase